jgi:exodeoxyribonuclease VIII
VAPFASPSMPTGLMDWSHERHIADRTAISFGAMERFGVVDDSGEESNPAAFQSYWNRETTDATTASLELGSLIHMAIYEPDRLLAEVAVRPTKDDGSLIRSNSKEFRTWAAENVGKRFVRPVDLDLVTGMVAASLESRALVQLRRLETVAIERSMVWVDPETGLRLRIRVDRLSRRQDGALVVEDLKSTDDASPAAFRRTCHRWRYFDRLAHYIDGVEACYGQRPRGVLVPASKQRPYQFGVYEPREAWLEEGRARNRAVLRELARRFNENDWSSDWEIGPVMI